MRSAARHDLDPADVLADLAARSAADLALHVYLEAGLDEREEADAHAHVNLVTEDLFENRLDEHHAGGEGEVLVYDERLVLEEGPRASYWKKALSWRASVVSLR